MQRCDALARAELDDSARGREGRLFGTEDWAWRVEGHRYCWGEVPNERSTRFPYSAGYAVFLDGFLLIVRFMLDTKRGQGGDVE